LDELNSDIWQASGTGETKNTAGEIKKLGQVVKPAQFNRTLFIAVREQSLTATVIAGHQSSSDI